MIQNKYPCQSSDMDDLEFLFDDVEMNDDSSVGAEEWVRCTYRGHTYDVPVFSENSADVRMSNFYFQSDEQTVDYHEGAVRLFSSSRQPSLSFRVVILADDCELLGDSFATIRFYLYRKGVSRPLAMVEEEADGLCEVSAVFQLAREQLVPGDYFLLGTQFACQAAEGHEFDDLNGHLLWPLMVLPDGEELVHPPLQRAAVQQPEHMVSGVLELALHWDTPLPAVSDWHLSCYSADCSLMGQAHRFLSRRQQQVHALNFRIDASKIWLPGTYFAVLSHNREPYACVDFVWSEQGVQVTSVRMLAETDDAYWMVKHLERVSKYEWCRLNEWPGLSSIRPSLIRLNREERFNLFCEQHQRSSLKENQYAVVTAADGFHAKRLGYCLPFLLHFATSHRRILDCEEWEGDAEKGNTMLNEREETTLILTHLDALVRSESLLSELEMWASSRVKFCCFVLCGTASEVAALFQASRVLEALFATAYRFDIQWNGWQELVHAVQDGLIKAGYAWTHEAEERLACECRTHWEQLKDWKDEDIHDFVHRQVIGSLRNRLHQQYRQLGDKVKLDLCACLPEDVSLKAYWDSQVAVKQSDHHQTFSQSMEGLNRLVGLSALKQELNTTFTWLQFSLQRQRWGLPSDTAGVHHMIFTGNPGTGKTTVAQYIGKIYHAMGLLSKGEVVQTERSQLLGQYIGETESKMRSLLQQAKGNVLFIDEAYTLCETADDRKDFGHHVIESLLVELAQPHPDMLVILAGYADEMERMMQVNQGLAGRFPHHFHFADYDVDELMQIAGQLLHGQQYRLTAEAEQQLHDTLVQAVAHKDRHFSNARWVKQLVESGILPAMAVRVMQSGGELTAEQCSLIQASDVQEAARKYLVRKSVDLVPKRRIGFIA